MQINQGFSYTHQEQFITSEPVRTTAIGLFMNLDTDLAYELAEMEVMIRRISGIPTPIKKSVANCYVDSPFVDDIALVGMPSKFSFPNMKPFDSTSDIDDQHRMFTVAILRELREACLCKGSVLV